MVKFEVIWFEKSKIKIEKNAVKCMLSLTFFFILLLIFKLKKYLLNLYFSPLTIFFCLYCRMSNNTLKIITSTGDVKIMCKFS